MLHRRGLLKGALALLPVPLLPRERSLAVCPASEIITPEPRFEVPRSARRPIMSFEINTHIDIDDFCFNGNLKPFDPHKTTIEVEFTYLTKKGKATTVRFDEVEAIKMYDVPILDEYLIKQTSYMTENYSGLRTWTAGFSIYFDMNTIKLFCEDKLVIAMRI